MSESPVFTPAEAAEYLGLTRLGVVDPERTVKRYVARGLLECVKLGGRMGFMRDQLDKLLNARRCSHKEARRTLRTDAATAAGRVRRGPGRPRKLQVELPGGAPINPLTIAS